MNAPMTRLLAALLLVAGLCVSFAHEARAAHHDGHDAQSCRMCAVVQALRSSDMPAPTVLVLPVLVEAPAVCSTTKIQVACSSSLIGNAAPRAPPFID